MTYYQAALAQSGYTVTGPHAPPDSRMGCDEVYLIARPGHTLPAQLYVFLKQGEFTLGGFDLP